ncbi:unnamed protein product [Dicrocoelium dendriticum]|nr:unnamed protein product [Dicrocoelium dendriticum]
MGFGCIFLVYLTLICMINAFMPAVEIQYDENGEPFVEFEGRRYDKNGDKTVTYTDNEGCTTTIYLEWPTGTNKSVRGVHVKAHKVCD